jgi:hypothetical protein
VTAVTVLLRLTENAELWNRAGIDHLVCVRGENVMKTFISIFAVALVLAFTVPTFAGDTEADCQKAGGTWDAKTKTCSNKY